MTPQRKGFNLVEGNQQAVSFSQPSGIDVFGLQTHSSPYCEQSFVTSSRDLRLRDF